MPPSVPAKPVISHLVLNVRDLKASDAFYTEVLGFEPCAHLEEDHEMIFYQGAGNHHHDIALVQVADPAKSPEVVRWSMFPESAGIVHIALDYGTREAWLQQITHMQELGIEFIVRGNHGMTHSAYVADPDGNGIEVLYDVPREAWENDVHAALNYFEKLPKEGEGALADSTDYKVFGKAGS